jgi:CSLREA domain-containing protein
VLAREARKAVRRSNDFKVLAAMATVMVAGLLLLGPVLPVQAQSTITVNTTADEQNTNGKCSLREAIINANSNNQSGSPDCPAGSSTGADNITFSLAPSSTIWLTSALPIITDTAGLTTDGGQASITISGGNEVQVFLVGGKLTLKNLTVSDGFTSASGGGLANDGQVEVINTTFSQNRAAHFGGAIINQGTLKVTNSTFTLNDATAADGGGIYNSGFLTVTNSTFYLNNAAGEGGGIAHGSDVVPITVTNSTFSNNSAFQGGGIFNSTSGGTATLSNAIMANNPTGENCVGPVTDGGYNIDDGTTCGFSATNHSQPSTDPKLDVGGLQNNGGPTKTIALLTGSPALNAIPKGQSGCATTTTAPITTDQRGVKRPQGTRCDIGAYEKKVRHH